MIHDCHVHMMREQANHIASKDEMIEHGIGGGQLISYPPASFSIFYGEAYEAQERLDKLFEALDKVPLFYPLYWIDPTEDDCIAQAEQAVKMGVVGFKIICTHFYPGDERVLDFARFCVEKEKPIFFHSGILYDGKVSSKYSNPIGFEDLIQINGLKFSLAHISWPWVDQCIALFGKFNNTAARRDDFKTEMYIDITPGTPACYRQDSLYKLLSFSGFDTKKVMFGSDARFLNYYPEAVSKTAKNDDEIMAGLGMTEQQRENVLKNNMLRFIGKINEA